MDSRDSHSVPVPDTRWGAAKLTIGGVLWVAVCLLFVFHGDRNPVAQFAFVRHGACTSGSVIRAEEYVEDVTDSGDPMYCHILTYAYEVCDGRKLTATKDVEGRMPASLEEGSLIRVCYLRDRPEVTRLGPPQTVIQWLTRVALGLAFAGFIGSPGLAMLVSGVRGLHRPIG